MLRAEKLLIGGLCNILERGGSGEEGGQSNPMGKHWKPSQGLGKQSRGKRTGAENPAQGYGPQAVARKKDARESGRGSLKGRTTQGNQ